MLEHARTERGYLQGYLHVMSRLIDYFVSILAQR